MFKIYELIFNFYHFSLKFFQFSLQNFPKIFPDFPQGVSTQNFLLKLFQWNILQNKILHRSLILQLLQGSQHYRFFLRSTEFRKWYAFLQNFVRSFEIFEFVTDFAIFWFFSTLFTRNWESLQLWSASIEVWARSCSGVVYNFVSLNLNFVIKMSKKFEKNKIPYI